MSWFTKRQYTIGFWIIVISIVSLNAQFPRELRGGVITQLQTLEQSYAKREQDVREEVGSLANKVRELNINIEYQREITQAQFQSVYEMREDVYPPSR